MITVAMPIALVIFGLGGVAWLAELSRKQRRRRGDRQARARLARDLETGRPSADLPYGYGGPPNGECRLQGERPRDDS
jgi:hypothetical protein